MFYISKKFVLSLILILSSVFLLNRLIFLTEKGGLENTYPAIWCSSTISDYVHDKIKQKDSYEKLRKKYKKLKAEYNTMLSEIIRVNAIKKFYEESNDLRAFQERYNIDNMILTKILIKNISNNGHYFIINCGSNNGVRKNMAAVYKFQLLGKVTEVYPHFSKVTLITDENCKVAAFANATDSKGIVIGQNSITRCKMSYVNHLLEVVNDDLVFSSGQGLVFPEGFCLGRIVKHEHTHNMLYHEIEIEPLIKLKKLKYCMLVDQTKINLF
ncbi:MAG: Cell shape-determining protein MreC [candidate division TM6 bacterium GW2011_GWF2_37_49]|nr:MAG: Cell shape-determining protein MreC [candidate division TM6 bacterium GW2011_GWF2_37_49]